MKDKKKEDKYCGQAVSYIDVPSYQDSTGFFTDLPPNFRALKTQEIPQSIRDVIEAEDLCERVWTTILALCILQKYYNAFKDEWILISKKAEAYLKSMKIADFKKEIKNAMSLV